MQNLYKENHLSYCLNALKGHFCFNLKILVRTFRVLYSSHLLEYVILILIVILNYFIPHLISQAESKGDSQEKISFKENWKFQFNKIREL